eukprot:scaffold42947_cov71-Phaeocystis_antarctica.AAC.3
MTAWPSTAANMRAVKSAAPRRSTLAPRCSSSFATRSCPPAAAARSSPRPSSSRASTCPPCCSHLTTGCSSPQHAAEETSRGSGSSSLIAPLRAAGACSGGHVVATQAGGVAVCCRSSSAMAACPSVSASCSAVSPLWLLSSVLAPASISSCTHSMRPVLAAIIRAAIPLPFCRSMLALCSSSRRTMACLSIAAANMRAVTPVVPHRSMLTPRCSSSIAKCRCPPVAAACSSPCPFSSSASTWPPCCSHLTTGCSSPLYAAVQKSRGSGSSSLTVPSRAAGACSGGQAEEPAASVAPPTSCRFAGLSSTASASPSTATSYRPLTASKRPATPHRPLSSGRAWRPSMRTRRPERLDAGVAGAVGGVAACSRSSLAMAAWPLASAASSAVSPSWSRSSLLAPAASSSCTHSLWPWLAAVIRAVPPSAFCRSTLALCSSSRRTMACRPIAAATVRAVYSSVLRRSMLAPRFSSSFATRSCPPCAAACSSPRLSSSSASMCPPFCSHSLAGCSSPRFAANAISRGSDMETLAGRVAACCRSSSAMAVWPWLSAICSVVSPSWSRRSVLAPASSSACTHSVDARLVLEQQAHHGVLALPRRHHERRAVMSAQVDAGAALQQLLRHAQVSISCGRVQQPDSALVALCSGAADMYRQPHRRWPGGGRHGRGLSHILQVRWPEQHGLCLAIHRHRIPPLGRIVAPRHATLPVELGPRQEVVDAHAAAREVGRGGGGGGRRLGCVLPEQLGNGGVAFGFGELQRRVAVLVAQLGTGARREQLLHALLVARVSGHNQGGRPTSVLQVDARLVLEQQAHHGMLAHRRSPHESGAPLGAAQVDAGTALQKFLRHVQAPTSHGRMQ